MAALLPRTRTMVAIGQVCSRWADIEFLITETIHALTPLLDDAFTRVEVRQVVEIAVTHMDIRDKISTAKVLATQADLGTKLYGRLERHLNYIDNELRLERNRFVHDEWQVSGDQAVRTCVRPKVIKPQAFQVDMVFATSKTFKVEEVESFVATLNLATADLFKLIHELEARRPKPPESAPGQ